MASSGEMATLKLRLRTKESYEREIQQLRDEVAELCAERDRLKTENDTLKGSRDRYKSKFKHAHVGSRAARVFITNEANEPETDQVIFNKEESDSE